MLVFFKCVAAAVVEKGLPGLVEMIPGGKAVFAVAEAAWKKYREKKKDAEARAEIQQLAAATFDEARRAAVEAVREAVADKPGVLDPDRLQLELYLSQIPATVRRSLKRADDPSGTTVPSTFSLNSPDDFAELLPARPPRFAPGQPLPGKPGWSLVELLGVGGFGEVWLARHSRMTSLAGAVKFCHGEAARDLLHESGLIDRVMAAGRHANIVPLLDVNLDADPPWVMYEFVAGGDLSDTIRESQGLPRERRLERALAALGELADAVGHFHRLTPAVVHRDLKPSNILRDQTGKLRITDFGIGAVAARAALGDESVAAATRGGRLLSYLRGSHTPLYASPQQRAGADPDPRDDVHALGVIAYQMITGELAHGVAADFGDDLRDAGASEELIALVGRCVAQKVERRPADGVELSERLRQLRSSKPVTAPVAPPVARPVTASTEKRPGVLVAIVKELEAASEERPVTKAAVLEALKRQFPERDPNKMRSTVNSQMPSQLRSERKIVLASRPTEAGTGFWIDAEATAKLRAGGASAPSAERGVSGARPNEAVGFDEPVDVEPVDADGVEGEVLEAEVISDANSDKEPGVINSIVEFLRGGTAARPLTKGDILAKLVARFSDRRPEAMKKTINCQVPSRLRSEKGLNVRQNDRGFWIDTEAMNPQKASGESFRVWLVRTVREQNRNDAAEVAERLFAWADANGYQESGNRTPSEGGSLRFAIRHNGQPFEVFSFSGKGEVQLPLQYMMATGPFKEESLRREYLDKVGRIPGVAERAVRWDALTGWPSFPLEVLSDPDRFNQFTEAVAWAAGIIRGS